MFSISSRYLPTSVDHAAAGVYSPCIPSHLDFHNLSIQHINAALDVCPIHAPSLCLLQAMTLASFYKLATGVYGQAWRLVGSAVRIAYEMRLHLLDYEDRVEEPTSHHEVRAWSLKEEHRRCWWSLWEMDIFASTIQRAPTAIDRYTNETCLPVSDEMWFADKFQKSCLLQRDPSERWKRLKATRNEDCFAWCILLSSLMRDAQMLSRGNIQGVFSGLESKNDIPKLVQYFNHGYKRKMSQENSQELIVLEKAYHDLVVNLPEALRFDGEALTFGLDGFEDPTASRRRCAGKYNTQMLSASVSFMISQNYVFADIVDGNIPLAFIRPGVASHENSAMPHPLQDYRNGLEKFLRISDVVLDLLERCPANHVKYVNHYYASTVWIAAALQIFRRTFICDEHPFTTQRKYTTLRETLLHYVQFWGTPLSLLQNLDSFETRVRKRQQDFAASAGRDHTSGERDQSSSSRKQHIVRDDEVEGDVNTSSSVIDDQVPEFDSGADGMAFSFPNPSTFSGGAVSALNYWSGDRDPNGVQGAEATRFKPPLEQNTWMNFPEEVVLDNFAWYTSDIMDELFQGYTT